MKFNKRIIKFRERFFVLLEKTAKLKDGVHNIQVAQVIVVGEYIFAMPEVAVIKDTKGRILAIPEDRGYDDHPNPLVSRCDVREGMKLQLIVKENQIKRVFRIGA